MVYSEKESCDKAGISVSSSIDGPDVEEQRLQWLAQGTKLDSLLHQFTLVTTHGKGQKGRLWSDPWSPREG